MEKRPLLQKRNREAAKPVLVIHGGAGVLSRDKIPPSARALYRERLSAALLAGHAILNNGGEAIDAAVAAVTVLEGTYLFIPSSSFIT